ncbi:MAG: wax ester/triacylglycerol synthase family O-acyltransferase [Phreatobacter sp.]|uniref:WS/DGAT/MGAT family O-acyltransferase n=1 Tax=Phreatobacter sp. TaxID=1966341 RepID=UPI001A502140|nr:wax ester/triacylglycerol synthase family O-acyltransferase [Phreatobacter sp.]MBL8567683.1 wax ester/triacylglycerol synthase family O-acyltransferase [Phreatobacter sp.]
MKQLSGIDATFLYMETPETPMHVAGLTLYDPPRAMTGSFYEHFRTFFASRVHLIPIFGKKLARSVFDLDHPGWVDAGEIDLDYHIRHARLPKPGAFAQLEAMIGDLHSVVLDRSRPLWQFTVIDGLADGRLALYSKVHHAAVDGGAGMVITKALYDVTETPRDVGPAPAPKPKAARPSVEQRAIVGLNDLMANMIRQHITVMTAGAKLMGSLASALIPGASKGEEKVAGAPAIPNLVPPKTPFNVTITGQRSYAARSVPLDEAKLVARATGTKLNDVVMAICAAALRTYLLAKKKLPKTPLIAFVPISLREAGNTDINNQVFGMNCPLATDVADPLERLLSIQKTSSTSKSMAGATKDAAPKDFTLIGAPMLLPGLMQLLGKSGLADMVPMGVNVVISNTQGPPFPLYCAGAKVTALYPVSIPTHGVGLNLTVQSYMNALDFGLTADRKAVPDVADLADGLKPALDELVAAVKAKMPAGAASEAKASKGAAAIPAKAQPAKTGSKAGAAAKGGAPAAKKPAAKTKDRPAKAKPSAVKPSAAKPATARAPAAKAPAAKAARSRTAAR